ncbi:MAG: YqaE/Pmp3 family membrane protein [Anaerolineaceae bacterium]|nr:YqaE/Pmp3 family membrane protein [Anaerolineaceae bacterium]
MDNRFWKVVLALIFPPLGVLDKGCGTAIVVGLLTFPLWIPGFLAALFIIFSDKPRRQNRFVQLERTADDPEKEKLKGAYIRLADGEMAEVVDDDHAPLKGYHYDNKTGQQ